MFNPTTFPFGRKRLFNAVKLKLGVTANDIEPGFDMLWQGVPGE
jgi:hypothetical protein